MIRLQFIVEGRSEEAFVNHVLGPHLALRNVTCSATMVTTNRSLGRAGKGGGRSYGKWRFDITTRTRQDQHPDARFTSMFDCYHLPRDFPGIAKASGAGVQTWQRVSVLEDELRSDINDPRFIPYIQLHEFEALILADPHKLLVMYPDEREAVDALAKMCEAVTTPEDIDLDHPPSKRIQEALPTYSKTLAAAQVAEAVGLDRMRAKCAHFAAWLSTLEGLR